MAKKTGPSVDELVSQALVKLATTDGPVRLTGKGDPPSLFTSAAGTNKEAIERLQSGQDPLVKTEGTGKSLSVRLSATGFRLALTHLPEDKVGLAAKGVSANLPVAERAEFLNEIVGRTPAAAAELLPLYEEAVAAEKAEADARRVAAAQKREQEEATHAALRRWLELSAQRKQHRIDALLKELEAEGAEVPEPKPLPPPAEVARPKLASLTPETAEDHTFQRQVARRLVSTWIDSWEENKPDARQLLETAIWNVTGFHPIGEVGQKVVFDGERHEGPAGVFTGDSVRVVRPGWTLEEDERVYVVAKAVVATWAG